MERTAERLETTIPQGRTVHIQDGTGFDLKVVAGCLWITQENDTEDKVLEAGETFRVTRKGLTLAHACKDVRLEITGSGQAGMPTLTRGGGYREFGANVVAAILAEWVRGMHDRFAAAAQRETRHAQIGVAPRAAAWR